MKIIILNFKKIIINILIVLFILGLLFFSNTNIESARSGLNIWAYSVVPSLFPFFIATELLYNTDIIFHLKKRLSKITKKLFNLSGESIFPLIMGTISGYPTGAKIVNDLRCDKKISKTEGEHLLACTNNSGPLFIIGTVGITFLGNNKLGYLLLLTHLLGAFTVAFLFRFWKKNRNIFITHNTSYQKPISITSVFIDSISKSIITVLNIGRFYRIFFCCYLNYKYHWYLKLCRNSF